MSKSLPRTRLFGLTPVHERSLMWKIIINFKFAKMNNRPEDETNWDTDEQLEKRHIAITDDLTGADNYPINWMNGYELHDLRDSCIYAMNEYARKE